MPGFVMLDLVFLANINYIYSRKSVQWA